MYFAHNSFDAACPLIRKVSLKEKTAGELNVPTLYPASIKMFVIKLEVEPLPFVPAMLIIFKSLSGLFNLSRKLFIVSKP